jgi:hypothetical protein
MRDSKRNRTLAAFFAMALLPACTTSSYRVIDQDRYRTELLISPDRILLECEDIKDHANAGDPEGNFGFMVHVLDEEDTVLSLIQEPVTTRKHCFKRQDYIAKILRDGKRIYIGGHGTLEEPRTREDRGYSGFGKRGTFYRNGRGLQLSVIQNEHGQCYSATNEMDPPCMPPEFPIKNSP